MRGNPVNQGYILDALGSVSERKGEQAEDRSKFGLERLIEQAREFAAFYAVIGAGGRSERVDGEEEMEMETEAMRESKVARDVVLFLESLRA
jgi:hypothetical protein